MKWDKSKTLDEFKKLQVVLENNKGPSLLLNLLRTLSSSPIGPATGIYVTKETVAVDTSFLVVFFGTDS